MLKNFFNQLRNNPRLRWGIALIIGIAWLYAVLLLRDSLQEQTQQHRSAAQNITRLRVQLAQPEWAERVAPAKVMAVQLEGKLWQAATPGLAQAALPLSTWTGGWSLCSSCKNSPGARQEGEPLPLLYRFSHYGCLLFSDSSMWSRTRSHMTRRPGMIT